MAKLNQYQLLTKMTLGENAVDNHQLAFDFGQDEIEKEFKVLQTLAQSNDAVIYNNDVFNLNLAKLMIKNAHELHFDDDANGFSRPLVIDLKHELKQNQLRTVDVYNALLALTQDMLDGNVVFSDTYNVLDELDDGESDRPFVESDVLLDIADTLNYFVSVPDLVVPPKIKFELTHRNDMKSAIFKVDGSDE